MDRLARIHCCLKPTKIHPTSHPKKCTSPKNACAGKRRREDALASSAASAISAIWHFSDVTFDLTMSRS